MLRYDWYCWGANSHGQLGLGDDQDRIKPTLMYRGSISDRMMGGGGHSVLVTEEKTYSWGWNNEGQLGAGSIHDNANIEHSITSSMMDVSCGWAHTAMCDSNGSLFTCGDDSFGQSGTHQGEVPPKKRTFKRKTDVPFRSTVLCLVPMDKKIKRVACGLRHTLVITEEGRVFGTGDNKCGQLGLSNIDRVHSMMEIPDLSRHTITHVDCGYRHSAFIDHSSTVHLVGDNRYGQRGGDDTMVSLHLSIAKVSCAWNSTLLLSADGGVYSVGRNHLGQLGLGDDSDRSTITRVSQLNERVKDIAAGSEHVLCLTEDGRVVVWGWGEHGQLGLGDTLDRSTPQFVEITQPPARANLRPRVHGDGELARALCSAFPPTPSTVDLKLVRHFRGSAELAEGELAGALGSDDPVGRECVSSSIHFVPSHRAEARAHGMALRSSINQLLRSDGKSKGRKKMRSVEDVMMVPADLRPKDAVGYNMMLSSADSLDASSSN
ncbi:putative E3 ubiquitin-protein ligase HERC2-like [Planoprotostelium fungivorum]|uniref:Putative E3 ubiquitin-protein ligase HERC2-like n=1 Tax=Planoprotostelium fungivorum TaxID=1890364 RepID=A0A2P6NPC4_9EUKA|nr:putative E3 ubiquitin-protein ligase HERC2-like [Planoprotostelium fungivorum]